MKKIIIATAVSLALTGCAGQSTLTNTAMGTGVGAAVGAGIGAGIGKITGNTSKGAAIGAAAGAVLGTGAAYYMDQQAKALEEGLQGTAVQVEKQPDNTVKVVMPGNVAFATNSAELNSSFYPALDSVAKVLTDAPATTLAIIGYTDSRGTLDLNKALSKNRADTVGRYLVSKGVSVQRIQTSGLADSNPIASNDTEEGRAKNRRVEIKLQAITQQQ